MTRFAPALALVACLLTAGLAAASSPSEQSSPQQAVAWTLADTWEPSFDAGQLLDPGGADAAAGSLFVADTGHRRIVRFGGMTVTGAIGGPDELVEPRDVALDTSRGRLYVADEGGRKLAVYDMSGTLLATWRSAGPDETFVPFAVAVDETSGDVFALSSALVPRVERFRSDGTWVTGWGALGLGTGQFISPSDLMVDPSRKLLVADEGGGRIQLFDLNGSSIGQWSGLLGVKAIDVDPQSGRTYALAGSTADRVAVVSPIGMIEATHISRNLAPNQQWHPGTGIALTGPAQVAITAGFGSPADAQGVRWYETAPFGFVGASTADPRAFPGFVSPSALDVGPDGTVHVLDPAVRATHRVSTGGSVTGWVASGRGDEIEVGPSGETYVADLRRGVVLRRLGPNGALDWEKTCDCMSGMGLAATPAGVYATDGLSRTIQLFDLVPGRDQPIDSLTTTPLPYAWPTDIALDQTGRIWAVDAIGEQIHVLDPQGAPAVTHALDSAPQRISIAPDGTAFVLLLDGSVAALAADGSAITKWRVVFDTGSPAVRPIDIAAGPGGRVYVLDGTTGAILVYEPDPDPGSEPPPSPGCSTTGDKTAAPNRVRLGDEVTVTLALDIRCSAGTGSDIVLILDRSSSMAGAGCNRLCDAKAAARGFIDNVDLVRHRVAVVSFADTAVLDIGLSDDKNAIRSAIDKVLPAGNTNIAAAIATAQEHLAAAGRANSQPVVLLLTDGDPSGTEQAFLDAIREGIRVRALGGVLYAIGLGNNVNAELLTVLAGAPERYFFAPRANDLGPIYDSLAGSIDSIAPTDLVVEDRLGPDVDYVNGSATGNPELIGRTLYWRIATVGAGGFRATYRVRPRVLGTVPTNEIAFATYDLAGSRERFDYPVPTVLVEAVETPTPTATPTRTATSRPPTATATPTRGPTAPPRSVYLPLTFKDVCRARDRARGADIVLVIDTSSSMEGDKLTAAIAAAQSFVAAVDPSRDRVGVVSFDAGARLLYVLTSDLPSVSRALNGLTTTPGTRIDLGVQAALREMGYRGRPGSRPVFVLLSDGVPTEGTSGLVRDAAQAVRDSGASMFTIGLGADVDGALLASMVSGDGRYLFAPGPEDLERVYAQVVEHLPCR